MVLESLPACSEEEGTGGLGQGEQHQAVITSHLHLGKNLYSSELPRDWKVAGRKQ